MQLHTNDLWMIQESDTYYIYIGDRKRRGKLILTYDYASQFILNAEFCFVTESAIRGVYLLNVLWRYGIPGTIKVQTDRPQTDYWRQRAMALGIYLTVEKDKLNDYEISRLEKQWKWNLIKLQLQKYKNLKEFKKEVEKLVEEWNKEGDSTKIKSSRADEYHKHIQNHIFVEKEALRQSYLVPYKGTVTETGTVQVFHRHYEVPEGYFGQKMVFHVSLEQKKEIFILDECSHFLLHRCPLVRQE